MPMKERQYPSQGVFAAPPVAVTTGRIGAFVADDGVPIEFGQQNGVVR